MSGKQPSLPFLLGAAGALGIASTAGIALAPTLLSYSPLLLIALAPLGRHVVLAAPVTAFVPLLVVATLRRMVTNTLGYYVGQAYGEQGLVFVEQRFPRARPILRGLERLMKRAAPIVVLVAPGPLISALAGTTSMPLRWFLPCATIGQMLWLTLTYRIGEALSAWVLPVLEWLEEHMVSTTLACVALVLLYRFVRRGRDQVALPPLDPQVVAPPRSGEP